MEEKGGKIHEGRVAFCFEDPALALKGQRKFQQEHTPSRHFLSGHALHERAPQSFAS